MSRRELDEKHRADGEDVGQHVEEEDSGQLEYGEQTHTEQRSDEVRDSDRKLEHAIGVPEVAFGHNLRNRRLECHPLECHGAGD